VSGLGWTCTVCGEYHETSLRDIRFELPEPVFRLTDEERTRRAYVEDDWCQFVDDAGGTRSYVRGLLHLPVKGSADDFRFGVWVELEEAVARGLGELWDQAEGHLSAPRFGSLANQITSFEGTIGARVALQVRHVSVLPAVIALDADEPIALAQRDGIDERRAQRLAESVLH